MPSHRWGQHGSGSGSGHNKPEYEFPALENFAKNVYHDIGEVVQQSIFDPNVTSSSDAGLTVRDALNYFEKLGGYVVLNELVHKLGLK